MSLLDDAKKLIDQAKEAGDLNKDGQTNKADLDVAKQKADLNKDGDVNKKDLDSILDTFKKK